MSSLCDPRLAVQEGKNNRNLSKRREKRVTGMKTAHETAVEKEEKRRRGTDGQVELAELAE